MSGTPWTAADLERLAQLRADGVAINDIARALNRSTAAVVTAAHAYRLPAMRQQQRWSAEELRILADTATMRPRVATAMARLHAAGFMRSAVQIKKKIENETAPTPSRRRIVAAPPTSPDTTRLDREDVRTYGRLSAEERDILRAAHQQTELPRATAARRALFHAGYRRSYYAIDELLRRHHGPAPRTRKRPA